MSSKLGQLRELVRKEIVAALREEDEKTPEQKAADLALIKAKQNKAKADVKAAQTQLAKAAK